MISLDAYRISIGNFDRARQYDLRSLYSTSKFGSTSRVTRNGRPRSPSILALVLLTCIILIQAGDVETNPGPVTIYKIVKATTHQGNGAVYGRTAGSQCMFMSLSAIVYSNARAPRYWDTNDLDTVLKIGNDLYGSLGYTDHFLSFDELPLHIEIANNVVDFERTTPTVSALTQESRNFIEIPAGYNSGIFLGGSSGTAFMFHGNSYYLFDSHSRNESGMYGGNTGTSVLLVFQTKLDLENYIRAFHLDQFSNEFVGMGVQYIKVFIKDFLAFRRIEVSVIFN